MQKSFGFVGPLVIQTLALVPFWIGLLLAMLGVLIPLEVTFPLKTATSPQSLSGLAASMIFMWAGLACLMLGYILNLARTQDMNRRMKIDRAFYIVLNVMMMGILLVGIGALFWSRFVGMFFSALLGWVATITWSEKHRWLAGLLDGLQAMVQILVTAVAVAYSIPLFFSLFSL